MMKDLAILPLWYAAEGDFVFVDGDQEPPPLAGWLPEGLSLPARLLTRKEMAAASSRLPRLEAAPWGASKQSERLFGELKQSYALDIDLPAWKDEYACLTSRRTAARCLTEIQRLLPDFDFPAAPVFFSRPDEIESYLRRHPGSFVLKAPYSSSGRGLIWLNENRPDHSDWNRIKGILRKQGAAGLERKLNKTLDFALEFASDGKGNLRYEGLSVFDTNTRGGYLGNRLQAQSDLRKLLLTYVGEEALLRVKEAAAQAIRRMYANCYAGYLGVDMLIYQREDGSCGVHPCVEINLRRTMGLLAIRLFANYVHPASSALFTVLHQSAPRLACERHRRMAQAHPPRIREGRLQKGYLSLCPVAEDTRYTAAILAEQPE
jgi:hypothetical protein